MEWNGVRSSRSARQAPPQERAQRGSKRRPASSATTAAAELPLARVGPSANGRALFLQVVKVSATADRQFARRVRFVKLVEPEGGLVTLSPKPMTRLAENSSNATFAHHSVRSRSTAEARRPSSSYGTGCSPDEAEGRPTAQVQMPPGNGEPPSQ